MASRWESLLDRKPVPLVEHLLEEVAKLVAADLERWPLPLTELDLSTGRQFEPLLAPGSARPGEAVFREAFRLARWELSHQAEAYDDYMRNRRWAEQGIPPNEKQALLLASRWLVEQLLSLAEATEGRVKRGHLLDCLERIERHHRARK
ncbi:MAG: hypothetical protein HYZ28_14805 [Myxococcales bacterium]|nr:hypothetical protein [Myxococcales bacterium]